MKPSGLFSILFGKKVQNGQDADSDEVTTERQDMIRGIEELSETTVKEVMVPRIDTVFIPIDADREELLATVTGCGHSRIPVYRETIDDVVGVLYVKDLLHAIVKKGDVDLASLVRKPFFVPDSKRIDSLLREFKRRHVHIAIAIDEYGGVSGIVCMEDIIEEIVGDIQDEFDNEREDVVGIGDSSWLVDARINIEDLNEEIFLDIPDDEFDTLGGFVFDLFGKIPSRYEKVVWREWDFVIQEMDGHRIGTVKILRRPEAPGEQ
ncbi:MAG: magnesium/cobalt efflux protein [Spirochaetes bacterium RIFOXYC1_FULL_54_7]|nr:MAG: magnesium/cobalt efflux protein [Spirochaetes bacterium RIFOXYC1_FULL_54_7]